jgi:flagellin
MENSMERLATGKRINSASDDAAGVAIASRLTSEIRGTNQAIRNAMDGQAMIDTAEGAHGEVENILQRMREIAVQASNDTNNADDRSNLQAEINALTNEIDRISSTTTWAGTKLLDGSDTDGFAFQVGSRTASSDTITTTIASTSAATLGIGAISTSTITAATGGATVTAGSIAMTANTAVTVDVGSNSFTLGYNVVTGTNNAAAVSAVAGGFSLSVTSSTTNTASTFTVNGVEISYNSGASDKTAVEAMEAAFNSAKALTANANTLGHITATKDTTDTSEHVDFTTTAANKALVMKNLMSANTTVAADFALDNTTTSGTLIMTSNSVKSATSIASATTHNGTTGGNSVTATSGGLTVVANTTLDTATTSNVFNVTVDGITVAYDTFVDGVSKGYTGVADANAASKSLADGLIQKLEDAGLKGVTATNTNGAIVFTKGAASSVTTTTNALATIERIDSALKTIGNQRAALGSVSNRLDSTVSNLTNISANLSAGKGRIEDADFAAETTNLAKTQILQQASTAMLAQANASKQGVLSLLQG